MPLAEARHIDIGVEGEQDGLVMISRLDMIAMVRNLVDNAIRYTPEGGRVDMSVAINDGHAVLAIQDSGPGIPVAERQRAFDPFYRILGSDQRGSGLGLSIVKTISDRVGATIELGFSDESSRSGLRIRIFIPLADGFRSTST
jgi:two-component system OmpR family sensor kinase